MLFLMPLLYFYIIVLKQQSFRKSLSSCQWVNLISKLLIAFFMVARNCQCGYFYHFLITSKKKLVDILLSFKFGERYLSFMKISILNPDFELQLSWPTNKLSSALVHFLILFLLNLIIFNLFLFCLILEKTNLAKFVDYPLLEMIDFFIVK